MPLIATFFSWLLSYVPPLVAKVLTALGIGVATYTGVDMAFDTVKTALLGQFSGLSGDVAMVIGLLQFDRCINVIISAISSKFGIQAANGVIDKITLTNKRRV